MFTTVFVLKCLNKPNASLFWRAAHNCTSKDKEGMRGKARCQYSPPRFSNNTIFWFAKTIWVSRISVLQRAKRRWGPHWPFYPSRFRNSIFCWRKKMRPSYLSHQFGGFRGKDFLYFGTILSSQSKNIFILPRLGVQRVHKDMLCNVVQHSGNIKATF